jgi:hypothetical protein
MAVKPQAFQVNEFNDLLDGSVAGLRQQKPCTVSEN